MSHSQWEARSQLKPRYGAQWSPIVVLLGVSFLALVQLTGIAVLYHVTSIILPLLAVLVGAVALCRHWYAEIPADESFKHHCTPLSERWLIDDGVVHVMCWRASQADMTDWSVQSSGARVFTADAVVVCLHGLVDSSHAFIPWVDALRKEAEREGTSVDVLAIDLPAHGLTGPWVPSVDSSKEESLALTPYSREADVYFVRQVLQFAGLVDQSIHPQRRVMLVGHSLGGAVATAYAASYSSEVHALVLASPWGLVYRCSVPEERWHCAKLISLALVPALWPLVRLVLALLRHVTPQLIVRLVSVSAFGSGQTIIGRAQRCAVADRYHAFMLRDGNRRALAERIALLVDEERHHVRWKSVALKYCASIQCPVQIQWGQLDEWLPASRVPAFVEALSAGTDVDARLWPGVGHCSPEQVPTLSASAAWEFARQTWLKHVEKQADASETVDWERHTSAGSASSTAESSDTS